MSVDQAVGAPRGGAAATLALFKQARDQVNQVLADGQKLAKVLGPLQEELEDDFQAASKAVEASCLSLVVVGGEGCGKSTLINTITGADVTPREKQVPGTVAPCFLMWGPETQPVYSVVLGESAKEVRCRNNAEFGEYILQKHNPSNHKDVKLGFIRWNHPVLERGLQLVDMPGVEGVSAAIRTQSEEFIKKHAQAVVGVIRDRGYGPLVRIAHTFSSKDMAMQAIVSNWALDYWTPPMAPDEAAVEQFVTSQRKVTLEQLELEGGGIKAEEDDVYVLHLPSACDAAAGMPPTVSSPAHERERVRFENDFWQYVQDNGVKEVILDASRRAEQAVLELDVLLGTRHRMLDAVLGGDEKAGAELAGKFAQGKKLAEDAWTKAYNPEVVEGVAQQHWETFRTAVESARDKIVDKIRALEGEVQVHEGVLRKPEAQEIWKKLSDDVATEQSALGEAQEQVLDQVDDYYCAFANAALDELFEAFPLVRETVPDEFTVSRQGLENFALKGLDDDQRESLLRGAAVVGGGIAGAFGIKAALGFFLLAPTPLGWMMGAGAGILAAVKLVENLRDGQRPAVLTGLAEAREQIMAMDTSDSGEIRQVWGATVKAVADAVDGYLNERISRLEATLSDPAASVEELESHQAEVQESRSAVKELQNRLSMIAAFSN